eukprot:TRINITY_DN9092_c0_g1_i1.p1 TRINITY_DN9092_c0_g1~~TRINITY_DN9092_c0_g1_i1.p1  ORF type:complete len:358 (+),score=22.17 TRINITY_DN9092_c0_g1_i1:72-1145(+)
MNTSEVAPQSGTDRVHYEWLKVKCKCGRDVMFQWKGYEYVMCEFCSERTATELAVKSPPPTAQVQMQAIVDQTMVEFSNMSERERALYLARDIMGYMQWIVSLTSNIEQMFLGTPVKYGNYKYYPKRIPITLPPTSAMGVFCIWLIIYTSKWCFLGEVQMTFSVDGMILIFSTLSLIFLIGTLITEPGIIPRRPGETGKDLRIVDSHGERVQKWCTTCCIHMPERASHCRQCDACICKFDHHCYIIGACIGERNFRLFVLFCISVFLLSVFCFINAMHSNESSYSLRFWTGFVLFGLSILMLSLCWNLSRGLTTKENMRKKTPRGVKKGIITNFCSVMCSKTPESLIGKESDDNAAV